MQADQLPILIDNATTCHKLQGSGVLNLYVHSLHYHRNWVYVMLSRVKTRQGLFLRLKLSSDLTKYKLPQNYIAFMERIRGIAQTKKSQNTQD